MCVLYRRYIPISATLSDSEMEERKDASAITKTKGEVPSLTFTKEQLPRITQQLTENGELQY